jgi:sugar lactone lactonase YvrE
VEGLKEPESVLYDESADVLYVTSMDGEGDKKDGNGYISKIGTDGKVQEAQWVTGLNAPKGLAMHGNRLYVADVDAIVEIDIASGKVLNRFEDPSAKFMNDVAAAPDGTIYASDTMTDRIYRLRDGELEVWLEHVALNSPNGLHVENGRLVVGSMGGFGPDALPGDLLAVSLRDKSITSLAGSVGHLDGVEADGKGGYYLTDWPQGKLMHLPPGGKPEILLSLSQGTADLEVVTSQKRLYLPRMMDGKLAAYALP